MSLKQWIAVDRDCHPKSLRHSPTQPTTSESTLPVTPSEVPQPDSLPNETSSEPVGSSDDGTALALQEFQLSCPD